MCDDPFQHSLATNSVGRMAMGKHEAGSPKHESDDVLSMAFCAPFTMT